MNRNEQDLKEEQKARETMNYNDRLDGYGYGEADIEAKHDEEEKGRDEEEAKKYGPVDQYTFREPPIGNEHESEAKIKEKLSDL